MRLNISTDLALIAVMIGVFSCLPSKQTPRQDPSPVPATVQTPGMSPASTATPTVGPNPTTSQGGGLVDVVVVNALAPVQSTISAATKSQIQALLQSLYNKASSSNGKYHLALVSSKVGNLASLTLPADQNLVRALDFQLKPIDALVTSVIVGCDKASTSFPDLHLAASNPKICGSDLLSLAGNTRDKLQHSWLWSLEPLREGLKTHFRSGAQRAYVFVVPGNPEFLDLSTWQQLITAQGVGAGTRVHVISSTQDGPRAECGTEVKAGPAAAALAQGTGGQSIDYCSSDWSNGIQAIVNSLP